MYSEPVLLYECIETGLEVPECLPQSEDGIFFEFQIIFNFGVYGHIIRRYSFPEHAFQVRAKTRRRERLQ